MDDSIDWTLLSRYAAGDATVADQARIAEWIGDDAARRAYVESVRSIVGDLGRFRAGPDTEAAWQEVRGRVAAAASQPALDAGSGSDARRRVVGGSVSVGGPPRARRAALVWRTAGWAAAACVALLVARFVPRPHRGAPGWRTYSTAAGQREKVTLSDGTQFTLAPASRLRVPVDYQVGNRSVVLDGEGLFSVVHDAAHPFAVRVGNAVATDIGTQFDARAYATDGGVRVAVLEGRVELEPVRSEPPSSSSRTERRRHSSGQMLNAGDLATVSDTVVAVTHDVDVSRVVGWTNGALQFAGTPVPEALAELGRWYDLDIRVTDPLMTARHLTATFQHESVAQVLDIVATSLSARVVRAGRVVSLTPIR